MLAEINRVTNRKIDPIYAEARAGDIQHSHADITLAGKRLAYKPTISFEEGLQRTIAWYKMRLLG
jgi:UDP-glucose 4-epimerase